MRRRKVRTYAVVAVISLLCIGACGDDPSTGTQAEPDSSSDGEVDQAQQVCATYIESVAPDGTLLLVIPQSVSEVRATDPEAWPNKQPSDRVVGCSYALPPSSTTTVCPDGTIVMEGDTGPIFSVSLDFEGAVGSAPEVLPSGLCTAA